MNIHVPITTAVSVICVAGIILWWRQRQASLSATSGRNSSTQTPRARKKLSVNYHITRLCNYKCGFCFHQPKAGSKALPISLEQAKLGLRLLSEYGLSKINFAGGEPFYVNRGIFLGELCKFCKETLAIDMVSVVTNGSRVTQRWLQKYGEYLDMMAVSIDSFDEQVNKKIGRHARGQNHVDIAYKCSQLCRQFDVSFKVNTVVNRYNVHENMVEHIRKLNPLRWKVFQCLIIEGENKNGDLDGFRDAHEFEISDQEFAEFLARHSDVPALVPEDNSTMRNSYLILDEYMRFLNCSENKKDAGLSILDVGVAVALDGTIFDEVAFLRRGGNYHFSKGDQALSW